MNKKNSILLATGILGAFMWIGGLICFILLILQPQKQETLIYTSFTVFAIGAIMDFATIIYFVVVLIKKDYQVKKDETKI